MTNTPTAGKLKCPTCGVRHNDIYDHCESACEMNAKRAELDSRIEAIPEKERCEKCGGQGELFYVYPNMEDTRAHYANCPKCGGTGRQDMPDTPTDLAPTTGANIIHKADTDLDTPPRSHAYFDQFDREGLEAALEQAENDVVAICKDSAKLKADLTDAREELAKAKVREAEVRDALELIKANRGLTLLAPAHLPDSLQDAWKVGASRAFNNAADAAEAALAGGDNAVGEPTKAQVREAELRNVLWKLFYRVPDNPPLTEAEYDMIRPLLAGDGNAVGDVVEAARNWSNAHDDGLAGEDARVKLLDALARLDGDRK